MSNGPPIGRVNIPAPEIKAQQRRVVTVQTRTGGSETIEAVGDIQFGPNFILVPTAKGHVGFPLEEVWRWEVVASPLSVLRSS